ncbi:hypothetical protein GXW82_22800 [Streptacidiphilus sp. 4-A2]|nr:hypothetical protein [Streptacidiphilus sp. 4-A2]
MNVGLAVLYAAFAVVALWLLGELLVQHRAPAHWRGLALLGFLGLVAGVQQGSVVVVVVGVVAFGAGQGLVTRSVKQGRVHTGRCAAGTARCPGRWAGSRCWPGSSRRPDSRSPQRRPRSGGSARSVRSSWRNRPGPARRR